MSVAQLRGTHTKAPGRLNNTSLRGSPARLSVAWLLGWQGDLLRLLGGSTCDARRMLRGAGPACKQGEQSVCVGMSAIQPCLHGCRPGCSVGGQTLNSNGSYWAGPTLQRAARIGAGQSHGSAGCVNRGWNVAAVVAAAAARPEQRGEAGPPAAAGAGTTAVSGCDAQLLDTSTLPNLFTKGAPSSPLSRTPATRQRAGRCRNRPELPCRGCACPSWRHCREAYRTTPTFIWLLCTQSLRTAMRCVGMQG